MSDRQNNHEAITRTIARIQANILAIIMAVLGGLLIFLMTAWLLLKGGEQIGPHLQLLNQYFIGYSVTWPGSLVGFFYGALIGGVIGWSIGWVYNFIVGIRHN